MPKSALVLLRTAGPVKHPSTFSPPSLPGAAGQRCTMPGAGTAALGADPRAGDGGRRWHRDDASAVGATGVLICPQDQPWARHRLPKPSGGVPPFCHLWGPGPPAARGAAPGCFQEKCVKQALPKAAYLCCMRGGLLRCSRGSPTRSRGGGRGFAPMGKGE